MYLQIILAVLVALHLSSISEAQNELQQLALTMHNQVRAAHHAPPLAYSQKLADRAEQCAILYAKGNHTCWSKSGHNVGDIYGNLPPENSIYEMIRRWTREEGLYNYDEAECNFATCDFTQMIWIESKFLGCGLKNVRVNDTVVVVCLYDPPGNIYGEYERNVKPYE